MVVHCFGHAAFELQCANEWRSYVILNHDYMRVYFIHQIWIWRGIVILLPIRVGTNNVLTYYERAQKKTWFASFLAEMIEPLQNHCYLFFQPCEWLVKMFHTFPHWTHQAYWRRLTITDSFRNFFLIISNSIIQPASDRKTYYCKRDYCKIK